MNRRWGTRSTDSLTTRLQHVRASPVGRQRRQATALHMSCAYSSASESGEITPSIGAPKKQTATPKRRRMGSAAPRNFAGHGMPCPYETILYCRSKRMAKRRQGTLPGMACHAPTKPSSTADRSGWRRGAKELCRAWHAMPLRNHPLLPIEADGEEAPRNFAGHGMPCPYETILYCRSKRMAKRRQGTLPGMACHASTKPSSTADRSGWRRGAKELCRALHVAPLRMRRSAPASGGRRCGRRRWWPRERRGMRARRMGCCAICWVNRRRGRSTRDRLRKL